MLFKKIMFKFHNICNKTKWNKKLDKMFAEGILFYSTSLPKASFHLRTVQKQIAGDHRYGGLQ